jgi:hypothetical protein
MRSHLKPILTVLGVLLLAGPSTAQARGFYPVFQPVYYPTAFPAFHHPAHWVSPGFPGFHPVAPRFPAGALNHAQFPGRGVRPGAANVQHTPANTLPVHPLAGPGGKESAATRRQYKFDDLKKAADRLRRRADALEKNHEHNPHWREKRDDLHDQADKLDRCREKLVDESQQEKDTTDKGDGEKDN